MTDLLSSPIVALYQVEAPQRLSIPELTKDVPILPPSPRHVFASRADFEGRFPVRASILRRLESVDSPLQIPPAELKQMRSFLIKLNNLDLYIDRHYANEDAVLREGQIQAFEAISRFFETGGREGYIKLPPRTGKTVLFIEICKALMLEMVGEKALVVVPSKLLADQTKERFEEFAPHLSTAVHYSTSRAIRVKKGNKKRELKDLEREDRFNWKDLKDVTIITRDSLRSFEKQGIIRKGDFKLYLIDEGHEMLGPKISKSIDRLRSDDTWMVAFTATPKYSEIKNLRAFLGPEIHSMSIHEAIALGLLTPFAMVTAESDIDLTEIDIDPKDGYNPAQLSKAIDQAALNQSVMNLLTSEELAGKSSIVFSAGVKHAENIVKLCRKANISAEVFSGADSKNERKRKISGHQDGSIQVLVTPKLLGTGYDNPRVSLVIITVPFTSPVPVEQFSTRPMTPNDDEPEKVGVIVQFLHKEKRMQHRQVTFLDCVYGAHVDRYLSDSKSRGRKGISKELKIDVKGIRVSTRPEQVLKVLRSRPTPIPPHELDELQSAVRELYRKRNSVLWAMPRVLPATIEQSRLLKSDAPGHWREFIRDMTTMRKRLREEMRHALETRSSEKMLIFRRYTQAEAIRHFERKHEVKLPSDLILQSSRKSLLSCHRRIRQLIDPLSPLAERYSVTPEALLRYVDERISETVVDSTWTRNLSEDQKRELGTIVAEPLAKIRELELKMKMRWDVVLSLWKEMHDAETQLKDVLNKDYTDKVLSFAEERTAEFIEKIMRRFGAEFLNDLERFYDEHALDEFRQVGAMAGIQVLRKANFFRGYKKFSRVATEEINTALNEALATMIAAEVSFTSGVRKSCFKTQKEVAEFEEFVEGWKVEKVSTIPLADIAHKYKESEGEAMKRLDEYLSIRPIAQWRKRGLLEDGSFSPAVDPGYLIHEQVGEKGQGVDISDLPEKLAKVIATLTYRERELIKMKYGLQEFSELQDATQEEMAKVFKVTRERVRQVLAKGIRKLQHPTRANKLRSFLDEAREATVSSDVDHGVEQSPLN